MKLYSELIPAIKMFCPSVDVPEIIAPRASRIKQLSFRLLRPRNCCVRCLVLFRSRVILNKPLRSATYLTGASASASIAAFSKTTIS